MPVICYFGMGRGRLALVVLSLYPESYHGGETPPPHSNLLKQCVLI